MSRGVKEVLQGVAVILVLSMVFIFGCTDLVDFKCSNSAKNKENALISVSQEDQAQIKQIKRDSINQIMAIITDTNNVSCIWDTVYFPYTISYDSIINTDNQLIYNFKLLDVYKKNDTCHLFILLNYSPFCLKNSSKIFFDLACSEYVYNDFNEKSDPLLLVQIIDIQKIRFNIGVLSEFEQDPNNVSLVIKYGNDFYGSGNLNYVFDLGQVNEKTVISSFDELMY